MQSWCSSLFFICCYFIAVYGRPKVTVGPKSVRASTGAEVSFTCYLKAPAKPAWSLCHCLVKKWFSVYWIQSFHNYHNHRANFKISNYNYSNNQQCHNWRWWQVATLATTATTTGQWQRHHSMWRLIKSLHVTLQRWLFCASNVYTIKISCAYCYCMPLVLSHCSLLLMWKIV